MPIYEYTCQDCGTQFERFVRSMSSQGEIKCPSCGGIHTKKDWSLFGTGRSSSSADSAAQHPLWLATGHAMLPSPVMSQESLRWLHLTDLRLPEHPSAEWAERHGEPFRLTLTGPAGGVYEAGSGGPEIELDAVELCWILSGRGPAPHPLLETRVVF